MNAPTPDEPRHEDAQPRRRALILVPGITLGWTGSAIDACLLPNLKNQVDAQGGWMRTTRTPGGMIRFEYKIDGKASALDLYEVQWDDVSRRLSAEPWWQQLVVGIPDVTFSAYHALRNAVARPSYFLVTLIALFAVATWLYATLAVAIPAIASEIHRDVPSLRTILIDHGFSFLVVIATFLQTHVSVNSRYFLVATAILAYALHLQYKDVVDVMHTYREYFGGSKLRDEIRQCCAKVFEAVADAYDDVWIVGHSIGAIVAMDCSELASESKPARLVTMGSFTQYLRTAWPSQCDSLIDGVLSNPTIYEWDDFFSKRDFISSTDPISTDKKYRPFSDPLKDVTDLDRLGLRSHGGYYRSPSVLDFILDLKRPDPKETHH